MPKLEANFFNLEPEKFPTLDLTLYSEEALKEMSYFLWTMYPEDSGLMAWRTARLLPLIQIDNLGFSEDEED
jgi:hypothetical protein